MYPEVTTIVPEENLVLAGVFGTLVFIGVVANILLIAYILLVKRLRTVQNIYVVNASLADILLGINGIFSVMAMIDRFKSPSNEACRFFGVLTVMPAFVIVLSMVVIARNRFVAVIHLTSAASRFTAKFVISSLGFIWILSIAIAAPIMFGWVTMESRLFCVCCFFFQENIEYGISITICLYFIPNVLIAYFYIRILKHIRQSRRRVQQHQGVCASRIVTQLRRKHEIRLAAQFLVIFLCFNIGYAPSMVIFWLEDENSQVPLSVESFAMMIFSINLIVMPIIYILFNSIARDELRKLGKRCKITRNNEDQKLQTRPSTVSSGKYTDNAAIILSNTKVSSVSIETAENSVSPPGTSSDHISK
jgi:hypothetical protein